MIVGDDKQIAAMRKIAEALNGMEGLDLIVVLGFIAMRYGQLGPIVYQPYTFTGSASANDPMAARPTGDDL